MKKVYFLITAFLLIENINAQTSWKGTTSTNWSTASNWTAGVPVATIDAIIGDANFTGTFQPNLTAAAACKSLTIGTGTKASTLMAAKNITVSGNITVGSNGTILHNTANVIITLKGNWSNSGVYTSTVSTTMVTFSGAAQSLTGVTSFQRITINAGSTLTLLNNITISNILTVSGSLDPTSAFAISGIGALTVNAGGTILVQAADFTTNYNLSGAITLSGTSTVKYASSTINQNITNVLTYGYLRVSGGMTKSLIGNLPTLNSASGTSGRIYVDAGTLDLQGYVANRGTTAGGGSVIIAAGARLKIGGTNSFPSNFNTISLASTSTVEYSGTNQTVLAATYGNLTLSSSSGVPTKTMPSTAITIAGSLTGTSVSFTAGNKMTVNINVSLDAATTFNAGSYTHTFKGNFTNNGTFTGSTSSVTLSGVSAIVSGTGSNNFYNLTFRGTGITGAATTSLTVAGNLATAGSGSFIHSSGGTVTMSGISKTISGNGFTLSNCAVTGTITTTANIIISGNLTVNGSFSATGGTITMNGSSSTISGSGIISFNALSIPGTISVSSSFAMLSNLSVSLTGSFTATTGAATINGTTILSGTANLYDVIINSGKTLKLGSNSVLGIANAFTKTGTLNVTTTVPNTVQYNSAGSQTVVVATYHNLTIANGGTKTAGGAVTVNNNLTVNSGVTFNASTFTHSIYGNFTNVGTFTAGTSTIQFPGTNPSFVTGVISFYNFTANKSSISVTITLLSNVSAVNVTMTNGTMQTGSNSITITGTRTGVGIIIGTITHNHAFVSGTAYSFEGPNNLVTFTSPSVLLTSVTVVVTIGIVADYIGGQECVNREYAISIPSGTYTNATLRLHFEDNELNAFYKPSLVQYHYNSGTMAWDSIGYTTRNIISDYVEKTGITDISNHWVLSGLRDVVLWNGSVSSAWENAANWTTLSGSSMANRVPISTDDAQIGQGTFTYNPVINSTQTVNILRYGSVQAATLTINSGSLTAQGGVKGVWSASASHVLDVSSGSLTVGTNFDMSDGTTGHNIALKIGTGSATITNNLNQTGNASVTFTGNGTLTVNGNYNRASGNFTSGSGTVVYSGSQVQTVAPVTYNNLSILKSAERATINSTTIINGNLTTGTGGELAVSDTITVAGNITIGASTNFIETGTRINLAGNWSNAGIFTVNNGSVNFNGTGSQSVDANTFNTILINKSAGTLSLTGDLIINSDLTLSSGNMDLSTYLADRSNPGGVITIGPSSSLKVAGTSNFPNNYITNVIDATSTVEYYGTVAQNIESINYGNLTLTNGGGVSKIVLGDIQVNGDFLINSGATLDADSNNLTLYGNYTNNGTFLPNGSTLILNGVSKIFSGNTNLYNLTAVTGTYTFTSGTLYIVGNLFVDATASINLGNTTVTSDGDVTNKGTLISNGNVTFTGNNLQTFQLLNALTSASTGVVNFNGTVAPVFNSTSNPQFATVNINNTGGVAASVPWLVAVACNIGAGATFDGGPLTHTFLGNFTNNGTVICKGTLKFTPIPPYSGGSTIQLDAAGGSFTSTGIVEFGGTVPITLIDNNPLLTNVNITNVNAVGLTPPTNWVINQDMYISPNAIFNGGTALSHTITGNLTNNGTLNGGTSTITFNGAPVAINGIGTAAFNNLTVATGGDLSLNESISISGNLIDNGNFTALGRSVTFNGSAASGISGSAASVIFDNIEQNKPGSTLTFSVPVSVVGDMTLTDGIINTTATNNLTLNSFATSTGGTSTSFINGPMTKIGNSAFIFPLGKGSTWARLGITAPSASNNQLTAEYFNSSYVNTTSVNAPLSNVSKIEYWTLSESTTGDPIQVSLFWENAAYSNIGTYDTTLRVAHWNGSAWDDIGQSTLTGSTPGNITSNSISSFSPFTFGSTSLAKNPLPIELISFTSESEGSNVDLKWKTATETNNHYFTLEKSKDGITFEVMQQVNSEAINGNSTTTLNYETYDFNPYKDGTYYRLKQTDYNGKFKYSAINFVTLNNIPYSVNLYPNPSKKQNVVLYLNGMTDKKIEISVKNILGEQILYKEVNPSSNEYSFFLLENNSLQAGTYLINVIVDDKIFNNKLIIE